jgi:DNA polymerase-3 subunit epsilon
MIESAQILFIDCQSTGSSPAASSLLEVAVNDRAWVIRQEKSVPRRILRLIGIDQSEIDQGVSQEQAFREISAAVASVSALFGPEAFAVAHFSRFEAVYLDRLWQQFAGCGFPLPLICTHKIAKLLRPRLPNYGLRALAGWFSLPLGEGQRASHHVAATKDLWQAFAVELQSQGINTLEALQRFCEQKATKASGQREFLIPRERRLGLPAQPGIYKYIDRRGRVLYVGKATSLKSRVNSYFTGGCRGDHRKLEMLAQAVDVHVTPLATPLCAGLHEYDEIRRLNPPYNIAFTGRGRDPEMALDLLTVLPEDLELETFKSILYENFYGLTDQEMLIEGIRLWRSRRGLHPNQVLTRRDLLNFGVPLLKAWIAAEKQRCADKALAATTASDDASTVTMELDHPDDPDEADASETEVNWTADMVAETCERLVRRATRHYVRLRWLKRVAGATIQFDPGPSQKCAKKQEPIPKIILEPAADMTSFDPRRTKVLLHELRRGAAKGGSWVVVSPWPMSIPFWI